MGYAYQNTELVYYSNRSGTWGTPFTFTGTNEKIQTPQTIEVFPNPAQTWVEVRSLRPIFRYSILDLAGRLFQSEETRSKVLQISLAGIQPGLYLLQLVTSDGPHTTRLMVR